MEVPLCFDVLVNLIHIEAVDGWWLIVYGWCWLLMVDGLWLINWWFRVDGLLLMVNGWWMMVNGWWLIVIVDG